MSEQPAGELPVELEPKLRFDSNGAPLIYDLGQQLIRDRMATGAYLKAQFSRGRLLGNLFVLGALLAPVVTPIIAAISGAGFVRTILSVFLGLAFTVALGGISVVLSNGENYDKDRLAKLMGQRRRIEFRSWAEADLKVELSEEDLNELQDHIGAGLLKRERVNELAEVAKGPSAARSRHSENDSGNEGLPYWMGGTILEESKPADRAAHTIDKPVMS